MDAKKCAKMLWRYLVDAFEPEEVDDAFNDCDGILEYAPNDIDDKLIDSMSDDEARSFLFDINYIAVNGLFGGDFGTWYDVLIYSLEFDEDTLDFLNY